MSTTIRVTFLVIIIVITITIFTIIYILEKCCPLKKKGCESTTIFSRSAIRMAREIIWRGWFLHMEIFYVKWIPDISPPRPWEPGGWFDQFIWNCQNFHFPLCFFALLLHCPLKFSLPIIEKSASKEIDIKFHCNCGAGPRDYKIFLVSDKWQLIWGIFMWVKQAFIAGV